MDLIEDFSLDPDNFIWQDMAICDQIPTKAFFDDAESHSGIESAVKAICAVCPVKNHCLDFGVSNKSYGIYGGKTLVRGNIQ